MHAQTRVQMETYCPLLAVRDSVSGVYQPLNDYFYWLGAGVVQSYEWIFVYTGPGEARQTRVQGSSDTAYVLHWGHPTTLLADNSISPLLMKLGSMTIADPPQINLPQTLFGKTD